MEEKHTEVVKTQRKAYSGYYRDERRLKESASGGAASAIAEAVLKEGGIVFGVTYSPNYRSAEYCRVDRVEDLARIKGSKYVETRKEICSNGIYQSVYTAVEQELSQGKQVLFIGLGCTVAALYSALKVRDADISKLFTVELICTGVTPQKVLEDFVARLEKQHRSTIKSFSMRYKKEGWTPPYVYAEFQNGKVFEAPLYDTDYGYAFSIYLKAPCYSCKFKGENHKADLTVGDYWGITKKDPIYNKNGVSIMIVQSSKGDELLSRINTDAFFLCPADLEFAVAHNPRYMTSVARNARWEEFGRRFEQRGLHHAAITTQGRLNYFKKNSRLAALVGRILPRPVLQGIKRAIKL